MKHQPDQNNGVTAHIASGPPQHAGTDVFLLEADRPPETINLPVAIFRRHCRNPRCNLMVQTGERIARYTLGRDEKGKVRHDNGLPAYFFERWLR